jgi:4-hydroxybenzoyl-CoA reductase subunit beta
MTAPLSPFELLTPASVDEAVMMRQSQPESRFLAGGTDLVANLRHGLGQPTALIDLAGIRELREIRIDSGTWRRPFVGAPPRRPLHASWLRIGACVTLAQLESHPDVSARAAIIVRAAATVAAPAHRNAATIGGNLCLDTRCVFYNQSDWWRAANGYCLKLGGNTCHVAPTGAQCYAAYSGDLAPALMVLGAEAEIAGGHGRRTLPLTELYGANGRAHLRLAADELLVAVRVPLVPIVADYAKARTRGAIDFPLAGVAVALQRDGEALAMLRVALTGTGSRPFLLLGTDELAGRPLDEAALAKLGKMIQSQVSPMRTTMTPAHYRRRAAAALAVRLARTLYAAAA